MLQEFAELRAAQNKLTAVDGICEKLTMLDEKLTAQAERLDQVQVKVDPSCDTLGQVQQGQIHAAQLSKQAPTGKSSSPMSLEGSDGILGVGHRFLVCPQPRLLQAPDTTPIPHHQVQFVAEDTAGKRQWMPRWISLGSMILM